MSYGWIDPTQYSFNSLLLMDSWLIRYFSLKTDPELNRRLGVGLAANPAVLWYFTTRCPDRAEHYRSLARAPRHFDVDTLQPRAA